MALLVISANSQIINIPDPIFKARLMSPNSASISNPFSLSTDVDANNDGEIDVAEAEMITGLNVSGTFEPGEDILSLEGIQYFTNLKNFNCKWNGLASLNLTMLSLLEVLTCSRNQLASLDVSGLNNLQQLNCSDNSLSFIDVSNLQNLEELSCFSNQLTSLYLAGAGSLSILGCSSNQLTTLDLTGLSNLLELNCSYNQLSTLDLTGVPNLSSLWCPFNQLTTMNVEPLENLEALDCSNNQLTNLEVNAASDVMWFDIHCSNNQITSLNLPTDNNVSYSIDVSFNPIVSIVFPAKIDEVTVDNTPIAMLDFSQTRITSGGSIQNNPLLTSIIAKNGFVEQTVVWEGLSVYNNPALQFVCADDLSTSWTDGPDLIEWSDISAWNSHLSDATIPVTTYCTFTPGGDFNTISGSVTIDTNDDGCVTGIPAEFVPLLITDGTPGTYMTGTNSLGSYTSYMTAGNQTITPQFVNPYFAFTPPSFTSSFTGTGNIQTANFCMTANGVHPDLTAFLIPLVPARPGFDAQYQIVCTNKGTEIQSGTVTLTYNDALLDFVSANPIITNQSPNQLSWNFTDLHPFSSVVYSFIVNVNSPIEIPAVNIDDILAFTAVVFGGPDETPQDNAYDYDQFVVGSYDPNDKAVNHEQISTSQTDEYLYYTVRFQNTGTYLAANVVVKDLLDFHLDWSTLDIFSASHPFRTTLTAGNKLEVFFENINLPAVGDDEPGSHGYVAFKIKPAPSVGLGDVIENTASIYFDYNFPIVTNTVSTTVTSLGLLESNFDHSITIYPNPANNYLSIGADENTSIDSISIYNLLGQMVKSQHINENNNITIDVSNLRSGSYIVEVKTKKGIVRNKLIKI